MTLPPSPGPEPTPSSEGRSIARQFELQAAAHPEAVALTLDNDSLTYHELNARANQLAAYLRTLGVVPYFLVGVYLDRSFDLIVAIMGILKAGGAYLPIDLACPEDRLRFQLKDAAAQIVLTEAKLAGHLKNVPGKVVCLDQEIDRLARYSKENVSALTLPEHLAYVIYTSGSTGTPKGVLVTQQNVLRLFSITDEMFHFGPHDVWTLFHSSAFDFSVWEIFGALLYGGRLVIVPLAGRSATAFHALLVREQVTVLNQTPAAFRQLVQVDEAALQSPVDLRYIIFGGEALEFESLRPWFDRHGDEKPQCVNMYGITETTVHVTYRPITLEDLGKSGSRIGHPLPDLEVYLVDDKNRQVSKGEIGEMLVGGAGVAQGYLSRPDLTRERFISNPFGSAKSPILYRSGDLAREREDGELEYLGRNDDQVKIRGYRIELHEIESVLVKYPSIRECAVISRSEAGTEPRLIAYLVTIPGTPAPNVEELRAYLSYKLPDYMVPAAFVFLPAFPLTINGKLDRAALPAPEADRPNLAVGYSAPQNDLESTLTRLWKAVLRRDTVGAEDNFFDLGGDSLLLTTLHRNLQDELKREIPMTDLFQFPTIRRLAEHLAPGVAAAPAEDKIQARARQQRAVLARGRKQPPS